MKRSSSSKERHTVTSTRVPANTATTRPTLAAIAAQAAVSVSSVSKVLNGRPGVSDETRFRVENLLHQHGYAPRGAGSYSNVIELVFFELGTEWLLEVLQGVESAARKAGYRIMLTPSTDLEHTGQVWVDEVIARRPGGVILIFSGLDSRQVKQLRSRAIPFVVVDPAGEPQPAVPYVGAQNWAGGLVATEHLIKLGHRDIAVITGPAEQNCSRARLAGFNSAMEAAGLSAPAEYVRRGRFHYEDGLAQGRLLFGLPKLPTAVFASADLQAMGVYAAAAEVGLKIPGDVSVVGFDDLQLSRWAGPPLTTVHQPIREMAEIAARMVIDAPELAERRLDLATHLVVRESTAPPRAG
jgi:LacI family xylobiose transport system transcriptional regulator